MTTRRTAESLLFNESDVRSTSNVKASGLMHVYITEPDTVTNKLEGDVSNVGHVDLLGVACGLEARP